MEMSDDWELLAQTAKGDEDAFRRLVVRHQDRLFRLCQRILLDREDALDATQEVFIKLFRKAGKLERRGELFTWLYRVATNHCLNRIRRRRIVRFLPIAEASSGVRFHPEPVADSAGPEVELETRQRWEATRRAIGRLPENQRVVLILARFEGLSYRQIAETLGITEGAVESRLFRATRNLVKAQESTEKRVSTGEAR